jgi:phosphopantetheine--protein transferase-like protein
MADLPKDRVIVPRVSGETRHIDLWYASWDAAVKTSRAEAEHEKLLSADELLRAARYTHVEARRQFVIGRGLLRMALADCTGHDPREFEFIYNPHGKPLLSPISPRPLGEGPGVRADPRGLKREGREEVSEQSAVGPHPNPLPKGEGTTIISPCPLGEGTTIISPCPLGEGPTIISPRPLGEGPTIISPRPLGEGPGVRASCTTDKLDFSVSHTRGMAVCAVGQCEAIGVDVEHRRRRMPHLVQLARRFFAPTEAEAVESSPPQRQVELFFRFWTLKEAYIKALGMGMAVPLASFAFSFDSEQSSSISFLSPGVEQPSAWQFHQFILDEEYQIALAVRHPNNRQCEIRLRREKGDVTDIGKIGKHQQ